MNHHSAELAIIDHLIEPWFPVLGRDFKGYRNHCCRVYLFCCALDGAEREQREKIAIAAVYHDLGIWTEGTFDYLQPSRRLAQSYLALTGQTEWADEIETMIEEHHKVTAWSNSCEWLVESFRKADWIDLSLGAFTFGLDRQYINEIRRRYPNAGFHSTLTRLTFERIKTNPKDPLPMFRW
ncbi:MAG: HD domain-containing protein [Chlorobiaceae bacterium]|nr:HD domain-containing protein [Chlorobiaceae bacterium]